jgi:RimJ/RimL family protein N-acetyltransferase
MKFTLRPWRKSDAESLSEYANNEKIADNLTNQFPFPYNIENAKQFIEMAISHTPVQIFTIDIDGKASGGIGLHHQGDVYIKNMEMGYWLAEPFWGKGIITEAIKQMVDYGFKTFDITRVFARPYGHNIGSQKALEKAGFVLEAKFEKTFFKNNKFEDELVYAIRND